LWNTRRSNASIATTKTLNPTHSHVLSTAHNSPGKEKGETPHWPVAIGAKVSPDPEESSRTVRVPRSLDDSAARQPRRVATPLPKI
jgi:hypothetical protein